MSCETSAPLVLGALLAVAALTAVTVRLQMGRRERVPKGEPSCSFCGKDRDQVRKLIAGPTCFICDECIDLCNDIIAEEQDKESRS